MYFQNYLQDTRLHQFINIQINFIKACRVYSKKLITSYGSFNPGIYNSAYFEHSFLAEQMGIALVEGKDLFVENDYVYMKTVKGKLKVDCIYKD